MYARKKIINEADMIIKLIAKQTILIDILLVLFIHGIVLNLIESSIH
jgi:hypothetical protein